jgi:uncharacterized membrane protein
MERTALESAASKYTYLRGLFFIPLGMLFVLAALGNMSWGPLSHNWVFLAVALAIGLSCIPISRFYNEHYGRLHPSAKERTRGAVAVAVGLVVIVGGSTLLRSNASWSLDLPVNATAVTLAIVMLLSYGVGVGLRTHHLIIWVALLVAGALPVWNGADPSNIGLVLTGVAVIAAGILDHRLLVRTFGPPKGLTLGDSRAGA